MNPAASAVSRAVIVNVIGAHRAVPVEAELLYRRSNPYAVELSFRTEGADVVWLFGRHLLMRGVHEPAGHGDVQIRPGIDPDGHGVVVLQLLSPDGAALVEARAGDVLAFLAHTTQEVWPGTEGDHLDVDETIAALLSDS
jgi:hypothetical protein